MEKDELLKIWTEKLYDELGLLELDEETYDTILEVLTNVYDVGVQDGKDQEKLEIQLSQHGRPYGHETI